MMFETLEAIAQHLIGGGNNPILQALRVAIAAAVHEDRRARAPSAGVIQVLQDLKDRIEILRLAAQRANQDYGDRRDWAGCDRESAREDAFEEVGQILDAEIHRIMAGDAARQEPRGIRAMIPARLSDPEEVRDLSDADLIAKVKDFDRIATKPPWKAILREDDEMLPTDCCGGIVGPDEERVVLVDDYAPDWPKREDGIWIEGSRVLMPELARRLEEANAEIARLQRSGKEATGTEPSALSDVDPITGRNA